MQRSDITCCVVDNGLFCSLAAKLAEFYGTVYYAPTWARAFPVTNEYYIGHGLPGVEVIDSLFAVMDTVDLFVFPDIYSGDVIEYLRRQGKRVWGSGRHELLELDRVRTKRLMAQQGAPVGPYAVVTGIDALRAYITPRGRQTGGLYVKVDTVRGLTETFHVERPSLVESLIDELAFKLGPFKHRQQFLVEDALPERVEIGLDGYLVDGRLPGVCGYGLEVKDLGYLGHLCATVEIPEPITEWFTAMEDELTGYSGPISHEVRINAAHEAVMIDLCARMPSPPSEVYQEAYQNYADVVYHGAGGELIDPKPIAPFVAEIVLHDCVAETQPLPVYIPDDPAIRRCVKLRNCCVVDRLHWVLPQYPPVPVIGAVCGWGSTLTQAVSMAKDIADEVKAVGLEVSRGSLADAQEGIDMARSFGLPIFGRGHTA